MSYPKLCAIQVLFFNYVMCNKSAQRFYHKVPTSYNSAAVQLMAVDKPLPHGWWPCPANEWRHCMFCSSYITAHMEIFNLYITLDVGMVCNHILIALEEIPICTWWRHQMKKVSALLALCAGNSPVTDEFPSQRPVPRSFDVFFDLRLNKRLSKQSRGWWFETPSRSLWRPSNVILDC